MQYTTSVTINLPRTQVIDLFDNVDSLSQWQNGLQSFEHLSGRPGQPGARSKLTFALEDGLIEMIEPSPAASCPTACP